MGVIWNLIHAEYERQLAAKMATDKVTQVGIAASGGTKQNNISRMLKTHKRGPTVETFIKVLVGSGMNPSEFFAAFESQLPRPGSLPSWALSPTLLPPITPPTEMETIIAAGRAVVHGYSAELAALLADRDTPTKKRP
jgi:hypothetical protein